MSEPAGYQDAIEAVGRVERHDRGLIAVRGADRAVWLHNLVTNEVRNLQPGEGNYAFAVNVKGRILFDLNLIVLENEILLDLARDQISGVRAHLEHYLITEDVTLEDLTPGVVRLGIIGPRCARWCESIGLSGLSAMAQLQSTTIKIDGVEVTLFRHDFAGLPGAELIARSPLNTTSLDIAAISSEALDVLRIESGIPKMGCDIDDTILPAETGQVERGISFQKGCYLGQEVVERMRSRGSVARKLVGLQWDDPALAEPGALIRVEDVEVGRLTSACWSPAVGTGIGLGYVRTAQASVGTAVLLECAGHALPATVVALPFRSHP